MECHCVPVYRQIMRSWHLGVVLMFAVVAACGTSDDGTASAVVDSGSGGGAATGGSLGAGGGPATGGAFGAGGTASKDGGAGAIATGGGGMAASDGGMVTDGGAGADAATDARADACDVGCRPNPSSAYCTTPQVQWDCMGGVDYQKMLAGGCTDIPTGLVRYCCPAAFLPQCR
jgi:hypothetical protein